MSILIQKPKLGRPPQVLSERSRQPSFELGYILGLVTGGDGNLCKRYAIQLMTHSKEFAESTAVIFERWCGKKVYVHSYQRVKKAPFQKEPRLATEYHVCLSHAEANRFIHSLGTFGKEAWHIPQIVWQGSRAIQGGFISGLFDSEGNATHFVTKAHNSKRWIRFVRMCCKRKDVLEEVQKLLEENQIKGCIYYKPTRDMYELRISSKVSIALFQQFAGFQIPTKRQRLENLITTFDRKPE
jgi:intein/homing endonuclease